MPPAMVLGISCRNHRTWQLFHVFVNLNARENTLGRMEGRQDGRPRAYSFPPENMHSRETTKLLSQ